MMVPSDDQFWSKERPGLPDIAFLKNHFYREGRLTEEQALYIIQKGTEILHKEPNLLEVGAPITGKAAIATSYVYCNELNVFLLNSCGS